MKEQPEDNKAAKDSAQNMEPEKKELTDYERYCQEQLEAFEEEVGDDRCFPDMPEGQFVRGH